MVFGENLLENAYLLAGMVDHIEIVLFYTPTLHNFLSVGEVRALKKLGVEEHLSLAVLPAARVSKWLKLLIEASYKGVINLEVFSEEDLEASIRILTQASQPIVGRGR